MGGPAGRAEGRRQLGDSGRPSAMGAVATAAHCHKAHGPPRACGRRRPTTATLPAAGRCSGRLRPRPGSTRSRPGESHRPRCPQLHLASKLSPSRSQLPPRLPASAPPARSVGSTFQWWPRASRPLVAAVRLRQRPSRPPAGPAGVVKLGESLSPSASPSQLPLPVLSCICVFVRVLTLALFLLATPVSPSVTPTVSQASRHF